MTDTTLQERLRSGLHRPDAIILAGVSHDQRCLEAADTLDARDATIAELMEALKEAGDVVECYHKNTGIDLGDASDMPFVDQTLSKIDAALNRIADN